MDEEALYNSLNGVAEDLAASGEKELLEHLLCHSSYLRDRTIHFGIDQTVNDFTYSDSPKTEPYRTALVQSWHILSERPAEATNQLLFRLPEEFRNTVELSGSKPQLIPTHGYLLKQRDRLIRVIQTKEDNAADNWDNQGIFYKGFQLSDDENSLFVCCPKECGIKEFDLETGKRLNYTHYIYTYLNEDEEPEFGDGPYIGGIERINNTREFFISLCTSRNQPQKGKSRLLRVDIASRYIKERYKTVNGAINNIVAISEHTIAYSDLHSVSIYDIKKRKVVSNFKITDKADMIDRLHIDLHDHKNLLVMTNFYIACIDLINMKTKYIKSVFEILRIRADFSFTHLKRLWTFGDRSCAVCTFGGISFLFDVNSGVLIRKFDKDAGQLIGILSDSNAIIALDGSKLNLFNLREEKSTELYDSISANFHEVQISKKRQEAITLQSDGTIRRWRLTESSLPKYQRLHSGPIRGVPRLSQSRKVLSWCEGGDISISNYKSTDTFNFVLGSTNSEIFKARVCSSEERIITASKDNILRVWGLEEKKELKRFSFEDTNGIEDFDISLNESQIFVKTKNNLIGINFETWDYQNILYEEANIYSDKIIALHDNQHVALLNHMGRFRILDIRNGTMVADYGGEWAMTLPDSQKLIAHPDGRVIYYSFGGSVCRVDLESNMIINLRDIRYYSDNNIDSLILSNSGRYLFINGSVIYDHERREYVDTEKYIPRRNICDISVDDQYALAIEDKRVSVIEMREFSLLTNFTVDIDITCARFSPDQDSILVGDKKGNLLGFELRNLTNDKSVFAHPVKLPEGVFFECPTCRSGEVCSRLGRGRLQELVEDGGGDQLKSCSSCGQFIALTEFVSNMVDLSTPYGFRYASASNDPSDRPCVFCTRLNVRTIDSVNGHAVCKDCLTSFDKIDIEKSYDVTHISLRSCPTCGDACYQVGTAPKFIDVGLRSVCSNCARHVQTQLQTEPPVFSVDDIFPQTVGDSEDAPVVRGSMYRKIKETFLPSKVLTRLPLQYSLTHLEGGLQKGSKKALDALAKFLGCASTAHKIADRVRNGDFQEFYTKSITFPLEKIDDSNRGECAVLLSLKNELSNSEVDRLASLLPYADAPYPWVVYAKTVAGDRSLWLERAERAARSAIGRNAEFPIAWFTLAQILDKGFSRVKEAEEAYEKFLSLKSSDARDLYTAGVFFHERAGNAEKAENCYRGALGILDKYETSLRIEILERIADMIRHARPGEAISYYLEVVKEWGENNICSGEPLIKCGEVYYDILKEHEKALENYQLAEKTGVFFSSVQWARMGELCLKFLKKPEQAVAYFKKSVNGFIEDDNTDIIVYRLYITALEEIGEVKTANDMFKKLISRHKGNDEIFGEYINFLNKHDRIDENILIFSEMGYFSNGNSLRMCVWHADFLRKFGDARDTFKIWEKIFTMKCPDSWFDPICSSLICMLKSVEEKVEFEEVFGGITDDLQVKIQDGRMIFYDVMDEKWFKLWSEIDQSMPIQEIAICIEDHLKHFKSGE